MKKIFFVLAFAFTCLFASASSKVVTNKSIDLQSNMMLAKAGSVEKKLVEWYYLGVYDVYFNGVYMGTYDVYVWID